MDRSIAIIVMLNTQQTADVCQRREVIGYTRERKDEKKWT